MDIALKIPESAPCLSAYDRPGWIPPGILHDWDTDPYAYQTEEELMPAGGLHGKLLNYISEILRDFLETKELMLLTDIFMMYRDSRGIKQRIGPDMLLMPFRPHPPSSYDLDTEPPPRFVGEVTSPGSHLKDLEDNVPFYAGLGIESYLIIDAITPRAEPQEQIGLHLWKRTRSGNVRRIRPDAEGYLPLPEMKVKIKARGQQLVFADIMTGEVLRDAGQMRKWAELAEKTAVKERQRAQLAEKTAQKERQRAQSAEKTAQKERQRAEKERQRAQSAEKTAQKERQRAKRLAEKLRAMGIDPE
ncbi:Uma2 family endonuclease [Desulfococcaceae bacterium HSG8]|nr:Uma2 family endonuclease [Desulfococcaceae bacterium HSG8]